MSECHTWRSDSFLRNPFAILACKVPKVGYGCDWSLSVPASACHRKMGWGQEAAARAGDEGERQRQQLCSWAPSAPGKSALGQPCCHLRSFYSRHVIYRNLFVQSQYLPVGAVKIYNPSVPLACCFPVNNGNFHHQEERLGGGGGATRVPLPLGKWENGGCEWLLGKPVWRAGGHGSRLLCCEDKGLSGQNSGILPSLLCGWSFQDTAGQNQNGIFCNNL